MDRHYAFHSCRKNERKILQPILILLSPPQLTLRNHSVIPAEGLFTPKIQIFD